MKSVFLGLLALPLIFLPACADTPQRLPVSPDPLVIETATGSHSFRIEVADTDETRATGLMFREEIPPQTGMLFDFGRARPIIMWMKNTPASLDMLFIDGEGQITGIAPDTVPFSTEIIASQTDVRFVLEVAAGTAEAIGATPGDRVRHPAINPVP